ncbi:MAG: histidinol-phosphate transaminase [Gammaproteobacteria bacterium]|nr:histidinol-phosphate transaminase [Gammaproteobacteria bacterium]
MSTLVDLLRPDLRTLRPYRSAQFEDGLVRLNANESPWRPPGDDSGPGLNRYPEPRPARLTAGLARHYGVAPERLLVTRGSSEAIDVITRAFCRAGTDEVVICPPTFGMYETYAQIQGAPLRRIPLRREDGYAPDVAAILGQWTSHSRVLFLCSPNNPTGNSVPATVVSRLADGLAGRGVVVLDAAYVEFAAQDPTLPLLARHDNLLVLRTLSKAMALAGVRCGALLGPAAVIAALGCVLPPYTFATVCAEAVERCLAPGRTAEWQRRIELLKSERARLAASLAGLPGVRRVWPSEANFLLLDVDAPQALLAAARAGGVLLRDFSWDPDLPGGVRITIGDPAENDRLLQALANA